MYNPLDLTGRRILVTGASSGIGRETAIQLSRLGANVVLSGRDQKRLEETFSQCSPLTRCVIEALDLSQPSESYPVWLKRIAQEGLLHGLAHCAGLHLIRPVRYLTESDIQEMYQVNVESALMLAQGFRQKGVLAKPASIVFVSSVMGLTGQSGVSAYAATKGALIALSKSLALELARDSIRVNCVVPGMLRSTLDDRTQTLLSQDQIAAIDAMHPLGKGSAVDVALAIAFLLADTGRWITGSNLVVDGGYTAQ